MYLEIFNLMQAFGTKKVSSCLYQTLVIGVSCVRVHKKTLVLTQELSRAHILHAAYTHSCTHKPNAVYIMQASSLALCCTCKVGISVPSRKIL